MIGIAIGAKRHHLPVIVTGDAAHVVMHRWCHWQRLARQVDTGKDLAAFSNAGQPFRQHLGINVIEMQVNMVAIGAHAAPFAHLQRH